MISSPSDYEQLGTKGEWANLQQSHAHLTECDRVQARLLTRCCQQKWQSWRAADRLRPDAGVVAGGQPQPRDDPGATMLGLTVPAAVEFSFLLGFVTLGGATLYAIVSGGGAVVAAFGLATPLLGLVVAFAASAGGNAMDGRVRQPSRARGVRVVPHPDRRGHRGAADRGLAVAAFVARTEGVPRSPWWPVGFSPRCGVG
jgi:hypothetical protein